MTASAIPAAVIADAVAAAGAYLRLTQGEADDVLTRATATALALGEAYLGTAIVARAFEDVVRPGPDWRLLDAKPVQAITGVTALPAGAAPYILPVDAYAIDVDGDGDGWVRFPAAIGVERVAVAYVAGPATTWADVPAAVAQGVAALAAHLFEARASDAQPPAAVAALWRPFRRMRIGAGAIR
ncbi:hypothetical protein [Sphingomonas bacterium]|uniref:head-tail connector protein n=1 Tax=Sphingomonas bacterium TaxID=1895847 RepID=UPI0015776702|nr:hypothetical protein [Sphingomonas bacterium]